MIAKFLGDKSWWPGMSIIEEGTAAWDNLILLMSDVDKEVTDPGVQIIITFCPSRVNDLLVTLEGTKELSTATMTCGSKALLKTEDWLILGDGVHWCWLLIVETCDHDLDLWRDIKQSLLVYNNRLLFWQIGECFFLYVYYSEQWVNWYHLPSLILKWLVTITHWAL